MLFRSPLRLLRFKRCLESTERCGPTQPRSPEASNPHPLHPAQRTRRLTLSVYASSPATRCSLFKVYEAVVSRRARCGSESTRPPVLIHSPGERGNLCASAPTFCLARPLRPTPSTHTTSSLRAQPLRALLSTTREMGRGRGRGRGAAAGAGGAGRKNGNGDRSKRWSDVPTTNDNFMRYYKVRRSRLVWWTKCAGEADRKSVV